MANHPEVIDLCDEDPVKEPDLINIDEDTDDELEILSTGQEDTKNDPEIINRGQEDTTNDDPDIICLYQSNDEQERFLYGENIKKEPAVIDLDDEGDYDEQDKIEQGKGENNVVEKAYSNIALRYYYQHLLPHILISQLLSHHGEHPLANRDMMLSFYLRDKSGTGECLYRKRGMVLDKNPDLVKQLVFYPMIKIDIGPIKIKKVQKPADVKKKEEEFEMKKEFVIDIDLTDYDIVRKCCKECNICKKCWKYAEIACHIVDKELRKCWNLKHILWVFSGRRGLHAWICDEKALKYTVEERRSIISYLNVFRGGLFKKQVEFKKNLPPYVSDNFAMCLEWFKQICIKDQDLLAEDKDMLYFLALIPLKVRYILAFYFDQTLETSLQRWEYFLKYYENTMMKGPNAVTYKFLLQEIVVQYLFPRMDIEVSKQFNHLLKCPFSLHPDTGNLALVIDPNNLGSFKVEKTVKLNHLVNQHESNSAFPVPESPLFIFQASKKIFQDFLEKLKPDDSPVELFTDKFLAQFES